MHLLNKIYRINMFLIVIFILSLVVKMYYYDKVSTEGSKLNSLEQKLVLLSLDNERISREINEYSSLAHISEEAIKLGYSKAEVVYLHVQDLASLTQ